MRGRENKGSTGEIRDRIGRWVNSPALQKVATWSNKYSPIVARTFVCVYFLNLGILELEYYFYYNVPGIPWTAYPLNPCSIAVLFDFKTHIFGSFVAFAALEDSVTITYYQL